jgi:hypothetical protein
LQDANDLTIKTFVDIDLTLSVDASKPALFTFVKPIRVRRGTKMFEAIAFVIRVPFYLLFLVIITLAGIDSN